MPAAVSCCTWIWTSDSATVFGSTSATAIHCCFMIGSVFGSPGLTVGVGVGADVVGGGVGGGLGAADVAGSLGVGVGAGVDGAAAVVAQTRSDGGPVVFARVTDSRKQTSFAGGRPTTSVPVRAASNGSFLITFLVAGSTCWRS